MLLVNQNGFLSCERNFPFSMSFTLLLLIFAQFLCCLDIFWIFNIIHYYFFLALIFCFFLLGLWMFVHQIFEDLCGFQRGAIFVQDLVFFTWGTFTNPGGCSAGTYGDVGFVGG